MSRDDSATAGYSASALPEDDRKTVDKFRLQSKREKKSAHSNFETTKAMLRATSFVTNDLARRSVSVSVSFAKAF